MAERLRARGVVVAAVLLAGGAGPALVGSPGSALAAAPRLQVSATTDLDPDGETITVSGSGYDEDKGVYVALCVEPAPGSPPSPCLGGVDTSGEAGSSAWVSSNPPPYGEELARPYDADGSFTVQLTVTASDQHVDCRERRCGIATRADHTRSSDRSQDVFVPVSFSGGAPPSPSPTPAAPAPTTAPAPVTAPAPATASTPPASQPDPSPSATTPIASVDPSPTTRATTPAPAPSPSATTATPTPGPTAAVAAAAGDTGPAWRWVAVVLVVGAAGLTGWQWQRLRRGRA